MHVQVLKSDTEKWEAGKVILDCSELTYISSTFIIRAVERRNDIVIAALKPELRKLFNITKVDSFVLMTNSVAAAKLLCDDAQMMNLKTEIIMQRDKETRRRIESARLDLQQ